MSQTTDFSPVGWSIRVVVVNHYGDELTISCLARLDAQDWAGPYELVLVDNGSEDGFVERVARALPRVRVIRSRVNRGFGGGCNLALRDLNGVDAVALVNNDATVDDGWLDPLARALAVDPTLGAACPRILFDVPYRSLRLATPAEPSGFWDRRPRGVRLLDVEVPGGPPRPVRYRSGFYGPERDGQWTAPVAELLVPADHCRLRLEVAGPKDLSVESGDARTTLPLRAGAHWYDVAVAGTPFDVVNNAGNELLPSWHGRDRGFLEADGDPYRVPATVDAWCGGAVLLRADYLRDVGLFDERFFMYYEDLELSVRGHGAGLAVPVRARVRHPPHPLGDRGQRLAVRPSLQRAQPAPCDGPPRAAVNLRCRRPVVAPHGHCVVRPPRSRPRPEKVAGVVRRVVGDAEPAAIAAQR